MVVFHSLTKKFVLTREKMKLVGTGRKVLHGSEEPPVLPQQPYSRFRVSTVA